jgi:uncharacterized membrane protein HdeD (DUF308 family)
VSPRLRNAVAVALVILGGLATFAAATAGFANHVLVDRDGFAGKVTAAVKQPAVSQELADRLAVAIVDAKPDAVAGQRLIEDTGQSIIASGALDSIVHRAALFMHDQAFTQDGENLLLDIADGVQLLGSVAGAQLPELRGQLDIAFQAKVVELKHTGWLARLTTASETLTAVAIVLPFVALLLFAVAVAVATRRGRAAGWVGLAIIGAAVGLLVVDVAARLIVSRQQFVAADAAEQALGVFLSGLLPLAIALGVSGAVLAAAGSGRFATDTADRFLAQVWRFLRTPPPSVGRRVVRALVLLVLGILLLSEPLPTFEAALLVLGFFVVVEALTESIALLGGPAREEGAAPAGSSRRRRLIAIVVGAVGLVGLLGLITVGLTRTPSSNAAAALTCNGSVELCDRPLDRVAFPTAHNAMSSAEDGFVDPNHRRSLVTQLDAGIRGLLIDSLMARPTNRRSSALTVLDGEVRETARREVGVVGTDALQDFLSRRLARPTGPPEPFLCHIVCELGALPMEEELGKIRQWLERNPNEVLVIVIQDLVSPEETEKVFRASGLYDHVWSWDPRQSAPTLRAMLDADRRVLVMAEQDGFADGWYQSGYERLLKETPYDSPTLAALRSDASCRPNRGREANPLFLVNHWVAVYPPRPSEAQKANARDVLLDRVERCRSIRSAFPNLIAVDFAGIGDVVDVAARVNGVRPA